MPRFIKQLLTKKLLLLSLLANACLLFACFSLFTYLKYTYIDYRHFRALPIGTSEATSIEAGQESTGNSIVLFGDSRIETWDPAPKLKNATFINAGVTGETTSEMKRRFERDVVRLKPDYVVIQAGMNDLTASVTKGIKDPAQLLDTMHWNLHYFIATLASKGTDVIVTSIIPNKHLNFKRKLFWKNTLTEQVQIANAKLKETTESLDAHWLNLDPLYLDNNSDPINSLFFDTLHINHKGYELLNSQLSEFISTL